MLGFSLPSVRHWRLISLAVGRLSISLAMRSSALADTVILWFTSVAQAVAPTTLPITATPTAPTQAIGTQVVSGVSLVSAVGGICNNSSQPGARDNQGRLHVRVILAGKQALG